MQVLVFSYSVRMLDILETFMKWESHQYCRLDGSTPPGKRLEIVKTFNQDASLFVFLISTRAGGLGLNLTSANKVVVFDPNWNPAHDIQAQDRAYLIGQCRNVQVSPTLLLLAENASTLFSTVRAG
jgi:DNA excision repair protein ERCC-6-like 2